MKINLHQARALSDPQLKDWAYNALDATGTHEVFGVLARRLTPSTRATYEFSKALQGPAFAMTQRGVKVNLMTRHKMIVEQKRELTKARNTLNKNPILRERWDLLEKETGWCPAQPDKHHKWPRGVPDTPERRCERCGTSRFKPKPFNGNSADHVFHLLYDLLELPKMTNKKGEVSADEDVLERVGFKWLKYRPLTDAILQVRNAKKQLGYLSARLTPDNRYPSSFNVGAAWTGRFSSSKNPYREGGNLQNVAERHRKMFVPDQGYEMGYADLEQAESRVVAYLSGDQAYIDAHLSGDVHTVATRMIWPSLPWTGDLSKDKDIAGGNPPWDPAPGHSWRFQAKRIQHGSNYGLTPRGISMIAHIPYPEAKAAWETYFEAFPGIHDWQNRIYRMVEEHQQLVNPLGRPIMLFGRPRDKHTKRQALSFLPQSTVADILDAVMWRIYWKYEVELGPEALAQLLAQVHDALLFQFRAGLLDNVARDVAQLMVLPTEVNGRMMTIPVELAVGRNWGKRHPKDNPYGIKKVEL